MGVRSETQQSKKAGEAERATYSLPFAVTAVYDIRNGFPMETCRKLGKAAINEGFAFANGVRDNDELNKKWGVPFWNSTFADPKKCEKRGLDQGDLGPASYAVLHDFPRYDGGTFNQIQAVIDQIRELPHLKTHTMTTLYPPGIFRGHGKRQMVVTVPCHGTVINIVILDRKLNLSVVFRSSDMVIGEPHDRIIYGAYLLAFCDVLGYEPGYMSITYLNAHYYENQRAALEEIVSREPRPFPTVKIAYPLSNFFFYRKTDFLVTDYNPHPAIPGIPVSP
jgi:thymidylate synthase